MKIIFVNNALRNILNSVNISEADVDTISIGESMIIIHTKNDVYATVNYKLVES